MTAETAKPPYSRTRPFPGKLLVNRRISSEDSGKETRHFEISIVGSSFHYEPGDSMAVYPSNDPQLVNEIIQALGVSGNETVPATKMESAPFREALLHNYSITTPTPKFLKAIVERAYATLLLGDIIVHFRNHDLPQHLLIL